MITNSNNSKNGAFFVAGGTLDAEVESYVRRPADTELYEAALAQDFCYVLTARQMGKSSLMVRTARRLEESGCLAPTIDLSQVGTGGTLDQWYYGLIKELSRQLALKQDVGKWWRDKSSLGTVHRFTTFLREVVLVEIQDRSIVIFIDEIDTTLRLDFSDDFFAAIRALYNARATDPEYQRLTFVLLGVATPADLMKDRQRTPFNIGKRIELGELTQDHALKLRKYLEKKFETRGLEIFECIFYWTDGHPYLTQRLCKVIVEQADYTWDSNQIDQVVANLMSVKDKSRKEIDSNILFVRDAILQHEKQDELLTIYRFVRGGKKVVDDKRSVEQGFLKLFGLVQSENGYLVVSNRIYAFVFDKKWINQYIGIDWRRVGKRLLIAASFIIILFISAVVFNNLIWPNQAKQLELDYIQGENVKDKSIALVTLFELPVIWGPGYDYRAYDLFFTESMSLDEQIIFFDPLLYDDSKDLALLIKKLYITLADVDNSDGNRPLLEAMQEGLTTINNGEEIKNIEVEIDHWLAARHAVTQQAYPDALSHFTAALVFNPDNPAIRYERARVELLQNDVDAALVDFEYLLRLSGEDSDLAETPIFIDEIDADAPIDSQFVTIKHKRDAIKDLINAYPTLANTVANAADSSYPYLRSNNLVPLSTDIQRQCLANATPILEYTDDFNVVRRFNEGQRVDLNQTTAEFEILLEAPDCTGFEEFLIYTWVADQGDLEPSRTRAFYSAMSDSSVDALSISAQVPGTSFETTFGFTLTIAP